MLLERCFGTKIGMTQIFDETGLVTPVSVLNVANWMVLQVKTKEKDSYSALQVGLSRKRYRETSFSSDWLKDKTKFFLSIKEIPLESDDHKFKEGQQLSFDLTSLQEGDKVAVTGKSTGRGFQGVVKRWNFAGGPKTHGSNFHRIPGAIGHMTAEGKVIKGQKMPGQHGHKQFTTQGLKIVKIDSENRCLFVKGAVPGKKNTVLLVRKQGK